MKITYIISDTDKAIYFENVSLQLRARNIEINFILINSDKGHFYQFLKTNNFNVTTLQNSRISQSWSSIKACKAILLKQNPDVIHCHLATANWIGLWAGKLAKIPSRIYTRHSGKLLRTNFKEGIVDRIQNYLATTIITPTKIIQQYLVSQGVAQNKIIVIHHGFDLSRFNDVNQNEITRIKTTYNPNNQRPVIGVISRWLELKGIHYIIDAFAEIIEKYPNALLCLFGKGNAAEYEQTILTELKKIPERNIRIVPFESNVFAIYSLFDAYVHVPINASCEAFGQTFIESLAAGCPAIFTASGVAQEFVINEQNALVVPFENAAAIKNQIERILENSELKNKLVTNGKTSVQPFSIEKHIEKLEKLYNHSGKLI